MLGFNRGTVTVFPSVLCLCSALACVPPLRATVRLRLDIAMQIRRAQVHRRPLARSCTPWRHTSSKTTPSLCPWRTSKNLYSTSVSGIVFAALAVCHHFAQLCVRYRYAGPPRPSTSRHTDPLQLLQWLCVVTTRPYCTRTVHTQCPRS